MHKENFYNLFYKTWKEICLEKEKILTNKWGNKKKYTYQILKKKNSIIEILAKKLNLLTYYEYYSIDTVLYSDIDRLSFSPKNKTWKAEDTIQGTWLRHIKIAFEHENVITGPKGGYQEICHLLTTNADYKVLVGYSALNEQKKISKDFQEILKDLSSKDCILLILGDLLPNSKIVWNGFLLSNETIKHIEE